MASAPTPGLTMGSTISQKVRSSPAPSILAASRSSEGRVSENCFIKNTPNGQPTVGKMTAHEVLYSPMAAIMRTRGTITTCFGSAIAHTKMAKMNFAPVNRFFANA